MQQPPPSLRRTILLLGGAGFIGSNLARELKDAGHDVVVGARTGDAARNVHALPIEDSDAILAFVRTRGVEVVVHLASKMKPGSPMADYVTERREVITPTIHLAHGLARAGVKLVFISSGGTIYGVTSGAPIAEDDYCAPISLYGQSKLEIETWLGFLGRTAGLDYLIVRPSNPYGRNQPLRGGQGLISVAMGKLLNGEALEVWGDGSSIRDYIYIDDLVLTIRQLMESGMSGMALNLGSGEGHSLLEIVSTIREVTGRTLDLVFRSARAVDVPKLVLDVRRIKKTGLHHARPLEEGIAAYANEVLND
jgi:UDP-glucose 4-epimerase